MVVTSTVRAVLLTATLLVIVSRLIYGNWRCRQRCKGWPNCEAHEVGKGYERPLQIIGIGGARTGSTALSRYIDAIPGIVVGDARRQGSELCCGSELYYFSDDARFNRGLEYYNGFYNVTRRDWLSVRAFFEKTPHYASHPMAPFRIYDQLGRNRVKLIKTIRSPAAALHSLYTGMRWDEEPTPRLTFRLFVKQYVEGAREFDKCWANAFRQAPGEWQSKSVVDVTLTEPVLPYTVLSMREISQAHQLVRLLWRDCADQYNKGFHVINLRASSLYSWIHLFGPDSIMCIEVEKSKGNVEFQRRRILSFINNETPPVEARDTSPQQQKAHQIDEDTARVMDWLDTLFKGEYAKLKAICARLPHG